MDECRKLTKQLRGQVDVLLGVMHMDPESEYGGTAPAHGTWPKPARNLM